MSKIKSINNEQAQKLIKDNKELLILDVRRPNEVKGYFSLLQGRDEK